MFNLTCVVFTSILTLRHTFRPIVFRPLTKCRMYNPVSLLRIYLSQKYTSTEKKLLGLAAKKKIGMSDDGLIALCVKLLN